MNIMNSPFGNIYFQIMQKLLTITATAPDETVYNVIKYIDMDYGQLDQPDRPWAIFPCVFIDFPNWKFEQLTQGNQRANGNILLKLATDPYEETSNLTPGTYSQAALKILELEYQIYQLMEGWCPPIAFNEDQSVKQLAQPMHRINYATDNRRPGLKTRELMFSHSFTDYSANIPVLYAPATPIITGTLNSPT